MKNAINRCSSKNKAYQARLTSTKKSNIWEKEIGTQQVVRKTDKLSANN